MSTIGKVDRKIFGVQSELLRCRNPEDFDKVKEMGKQWLQPRHLSEIVEERSMEGICGYPACSKKINKNPSTSTPTLRISYKEKRLYEVDGSIKFCCSDCLKAAASYEASLEDTNPAGRDVAQALLENVEDLEEGSILDGQQRNTSPPKFRHELLDSAGAVQGTKETIAAISTALRSYQDDDKGRKVPSSAAIPKTTSTAKSSSSHLMSSSLGALPILKYKQKGEDDAGGGNIPSSSTINSETKKSKGVSFSSVGKDKIVEKPAGTVCEMMMTGQQNKHQQNRDTESSITTVGATSPPGSVATPPPPGLGSPFVNADKMVRESPSQLPPPLSSSQSVENATNSSASPADIENISSLVKRIDFAPVEGIPLSDSASIERSDGTADAIIAVAAGSENEDESWAADDAAIINDRRDTSLFMLLWTALDDLFGNGKCGALLSADTVNFPESSSSTSVVLASGESRAMQRSTAQFIERGFAMAESHIKLDSFLPDATCVYYATMKHAFLACAELDKVCPPLSSTEWALLALLVVDALVCSKNVLPANDALARQAWNQEMELCAGSILRKNTGRRRKLQHQQLSLSLRDGDLTLLRSFFPRLLE